MNEQHLQALLNAERTMFPDGQQRMRNYLHEHSLASLVMALPNNHADALHYLINRFDIRGKDNEG